MKKKQLLLIIKKINHFFNLMQSYLYIIHL